MSIFFENFSQPFRWHARNGCTSTRMFKTVSCDCHMTLSHILHWDQTSAEWGSPNRSKKKKKRGPTFSQPKNGVGVLVSEPLAVYFHFVLFIFPSLFVNFFFPISRSISTSSGWTFSSAGSNLDRWNLIKRSGHAQIILHRTHILHRIKAQAHEVRSGLVQLKL